MNCSWSMSSPSILHFPPLTKLTITTIYLKYCSIEIGACLCKLIIKLVFLLCIFLFVFQYVLFILFLTGATCERGIGEQSSRVGLRRCRAQWLFSVIHTMCCCVYLSSRECAQGTNESNWFS